METTVTPVAFSSAMGQLLPLVLRGTDNNPFVGLSNRIGGSLSK